MLKKEGRQPEKGQEMKFKSYDAQQAFELWAFGHNDVIYAESLMHTWNSRHGKKLWLKPDELINTSLKRMYKLYVKERKEHKNDPSSSQESITQMV
jgi:hypothetical protein